MKRRTTGSGEKPEEGIPEGERPKSEEDLQPKDPRDMPLEPQNPVNPGPDPIR